MYERKILLGFIRVHILHHASEDNGIYGVGIIEELNRHGYKISPGTLYPILHEMEQSKMLKVTKRKMHGKIRKIYHITEKGIITLEKLKRFVSELFKEVV
jgi:DNA-binding PadR family transcriptional regulator